MRINISLMFGLIGLFLISTNTVQAQTNSKANAYAAYNGYLKAFLVKDQGKTYFVNSLQDRSRAFMWGQAYMISMVEDTYGATNDANMRTLITDLLNTFIGYESMNVSWDTWNDDVEWATLALIRGYQQTNNKTYLTSAINNWNAVWNRGWDNRVDGGIWELMDDINTTGGKCGLANWPQIIGGIMLYESTGDASYLDKSKQIYAWGRTHLWNPSTGRVYECFWPSTAPNSKYNLTGDDNYYNSGLLVNAAASLYKVTGNSQYLTDAITAADHVMTRYPVLNVDKVLNGDFGADQVIRGITKLATENNLWYKYQPWFAHNAEVAWSNRRTDYNITHNVWTTPTDNGNLRAMNAQSMVTLLFLTPAPEAALITDKIEAETFVTASQNGTGVQSENCSEGGRDVGWIDAGDFITYNVKVPYSGPYTISYRVASTVSGANFQLEKTGGSVVYGKVDLPNTGGWQNWQTVSHTVNLTAGTQQISIKANTAGWNINWFQAVYNGGSLGQIEAENFTTQSGVTVETTTDVGGGKDVGWIDTNDSMSYDNVTAPVTGNYTISYRVASDRATGLLKLEQVGTGKTLDTVNIPNTGGWQKWTTVSHTVSLTAGTKFIIRAVSGGWNLNWWGTSTTATSTATSTKTSNDSNLDQTSLNSTACENITQYMSGTKYNTGDQVKNLDNQYKCLVNGWCTAGGPYAPGEGWAWQYAWAKIDSCH